jgi:hypothetical protein
MPKLNEPEKVDRVFDDVARVIAEAVALALALALAAQIVTTELA